MAYTTTVFNFPAQDLVREFGSPLYVYDEKTLRTRCKEMKSLMQYPNFRVNYSAKANTNVELLKIICAEGLDVDAMSPGEMYLELKAGFTADRIMFIGNNVSRQEMKFATEHGILVSVDSLSQLEMLCQVNSGGEVCLRINPEIGAGHHEKVITAGKKAKFGIAIDDLPQAKTIAAAAQVNIIGLNQHIGSLFLEPEAYVEAAARMLEVAATFPGLKMVDIGGGFGIPYHHEEEPRLDILRLGALLDKLVGQWVKEYWPLTVRIEPGRYIPAESGAILGTVHSVKNNFNTVFIGTDVGFNVLARPVMYDSFHEIDVIPYQQRELSYYQEPVYVVGNICESGDILAHDRPFPLTEVSDLILVHDAGAYGFTMASNYNSRPLPAEVLLQEDGSVRLIRHRQTIEELWPE